MCDMTCHQSLDRVTRLHVWHDFSSVKWSSHSHMYHLSLSSGTVPITSTRTKPLESSERDCVWMSHVICRMSHVTCITWPHMYHLKCKRALSKRLYSAKETYHFKQPTNRSHPIPVEWTLWCGTVPITNTRTKRLESRESDRVWMSHVISRMSHVTGEYVCACMYCFITLVGMPITGWRRVIECLLFIGHFQQKNPAISGSFAEIDAT